MREALDDTEVTLKRNPKTDSEALSVLRIVVLCITSVAHLEQFRWQAMSCKRLRGRVYNLYHYHTVVHVERAKPVAYGHKVSLHTRELEPQRAHRSCLEE